PLRPRHRQTYGRRQSRVVDKPGVLPPRVTARTPCFWRRARLACLILAPLVFGRPVFAANQFRRVIRRKAYLAAEKNSFPPAPSNPSLLALYSAEARWRRWRSGLPACPEKVRTWPKGNRPCFLCPRANKLRGSCIE